MKQSVYDLLLVDSQEQHDVHSALDEEQQEVEHYSSYLSNHLMSQVAIKYYNKYVTLYKYINKYYTACISWIFIKLFIFHY